MVPHIAFYRGRVGDVNLVREALNVQEGEDAGYTERQSKRNEAQTEIRYVISMDSKMAPIPMLMFSAVMYLVCGSGSGEESDAEKPETHVFDKADHSEDRKCRGLPERQEH